MPKPVPVDVVVSRIVQAPPDTLYDLVSDIPLMSRWSPETVEAGWLGGATGPAVGARFRGRNRIGRIRWTTEPTIIAADRGRLFAFRVPGGSGATWTYRFEEVTGGTLVTESAVQDRPSPLPIRLLQRRAGVLDRRAHLREGMLTTLDRLAVAATGAVVEPR